jgi:hypothetical protein
LACALEVVGIDRLLFSVDYPYSPNTRGWRLAGSGAPHRLREPCGRFGRVLAERFAWFSVVGVGLLSGRPVAITSRSARHSFPRRNGPGRSRDTDRSRAWRER